MLLSSTTTVPGIFDEHEQAVKAVAALKQAGFRDDQIALASRELSRRLGRFSSPAFCRSSREAPSSAPSAVAWPAVPSAHSPGRLLRWA